MILRIKDKGHEALNGTSGDLLLVVKIQDDPNYRREGFNIHSVKKISITQAIFGGSVEIDTIHGKRTMQIHPGTQHSNQISIKGAGMAILGKQNNAKEERGDHIVTFNIEVPKSLTKQQKTALEQYAKVEEIVA